jgi:sterol 14-demethylase
MVRYRRLTAAQRSRSAAGRAATAAATAAGEEAAEAVRVSVDLGLCKGHAVCMAEAPEIFRVGEAKDSQAEVIDAEPPAELGAKLRAAVKYCPTGAIKTEALKKE